MRVGLPAAVPGTDMRLIGRSAAGTEAAGFASVDDALTTHEPIHDELQHLAQAGCDGVVARIVNDTQRGDHHEHNG
jgi:hypothetical protein